MLRLALQ